MIIVTTNVRHPSRVGFASELEPGQRWQRHRETGDGRGKSFCIMEGREDLEDAQGYEGWARGSRIAVGSPPGGGHAASCPWRLSKSAVRAAGGVELSQA